ncbi:hypothetical protein BHM03_00035113, partial [Ensete ventricosum]
REETLRWRRGEKRAQHRVNGVEQQEEVGRSADEGTYESSHDVVTEAWNLAAGGEPSGVRVPPLPQVCQGSGRRDGRRESSGAYHVGHDDQPRQRAPRGHEEDDEAVAAPDRVRHHEEPAPQIDIASVEGEAGKREREREMGGCVAYLKEGVYWNLASKVTPKMVVES